MTNKPGVIELSGNITFHEQNVAVDCIETEKWNKEKNWKIVVPQYLDAQGYTSIVIKLETKMLFRHYLYKKLKHTPYDN